MIFDTHAHYDNEAFDEDREKLLGSMPERKVAYIVNAGYDIKSLGRILDLSERFPFVYAALGIHPSKTGQMSEKDLQWIRDNMTNPKVVAVGEIGLDYYWKESERSIQKKWFERQLQLASEVNLPVIIHSRDAAQDTLKILKDWRTNQTKGVLHCFSYTKEMAREYLNMDYYFGIGGVLTFKNARRLIEAVEYIPMNRILLETDCPYLTPEPYRGKRNQSDYISFVAQKLSEIKKLSIEEVLFQTMKNARNFYEIPQGSEES